MKYLHAFLLIICLTSCAELQGIANQIPKTISTSPQLDIAAGLRQALDLGIDRQVTLLTRTDGFYKNSLVKIKEPAELQKVDQALRDIGLGSLADKGILALNRAAEDAVKEATPIFVNAVKTITFNDAKSILLGKSNAATTYLTTKTENALYNKFKPVIKQSFDKVGANKIWTTIISKYNSIPFTQDINPNLTDYVTKEALKGVYKMIAIEESNIRTKVNSRSTDLLRKVFALQD